MDFIPLVGSAPRGASPWQGEAASAQHLTGSSGSRIGGSTLPPGQGMCRHQELQSWSFWYGMEEFARSGIASKFNLTCCCQMLCQTSGRRDLMWPI